MNLICPECKNAVDLSAHSGLNIDDVVECQMCGITLGITHISENTAEADIVDEGK